MSRNGLRSSSSSVLCTLLDSDSRDAGSHDDVSEIGSWKRVRVGAVLPDQRRVDKHRSSPEWAATAAIGHCYGEFLDEDLRADGKRGGGGGGGTEALSPLMTRAAPWGTCLPVRITDMATFQQTAVGSWLEKYVPTGTAHPFTRLLFYELMSPEEDEERQYSDDTREAFDNDAQRLIYIADLFVPVEIDDINGTEDRRLPDKNFFGSIEARNGARIRYAHRNPPVEAWAIARPGQSIDAGVDYDEAHLEALDANPMRLNRFVDSYMRALHELMELERGSSVPSVAACKSALAKDYWNLRFSCSSFAEFRAADSRTRMLVILAYVYCFSDRSGIDPATEDIARRLEHALVRFVRSEFLLGWQTEHTMVDLLNSFNLDTGRVPAEYTPVAGGSRPNLSQSSATGAQAERVRALQSRLLTVQPTMREALVKSYADVIDRIMPSVGTITSLDTPSDLKALSAKRVSGCIKGVWVRKTDGTIEHRTGKDAILERGESFVITEGYPTRFYFVRDPSRGNGNSVAYDTVARLVHKALGARSGAPDLKQYALPIGDSRLELVVYPGIVFTSLAALRMALGKKVQDIHHTVGESDFWRTLPPCRDNVTAELVSLMDPQPSVDETMHGVRVTLMAQIVTDGDGGANKYSYDTDALYEACDTLRKTYSSAHPTVASVNTGYGTSRLPPPSIYWLRPNSDVIPVPLETLPRDAASHFAVLPKVDRHHMSANTYGSATIIAYRDMPFMLSEHVRALMRESKEEFLVTYSGNWHDYLIKVWACKNPTELTGHVRAVLAAMRGLLPISGIGTTVIQEQESSDPLRRASDFSLLTKPWATDGGGEPTVLSTEPDTEERELARIASDLTNDNEGDNAAFIALKRRQMEIAREAHEVVERLRADSTGVTIPSTAEPPQPNGLDSAADVRQRMIQNGVQLTRDQMNVFAMAKVLDPYMDDARKVPQRFVQVIWERTPEDLKRTIHLSPVPNSPNNDFFWIDRKTELGHKGPLTLLAYTYAIRVGNAIYDTGESTHRQERGVGYTDVNIADLLEIKRRTKEEADLAWKKRKEAGGDEQQTAVRKPFNPANLTGPLAFVRDILEHVKRVSATWPKPAETFTEWYRRLLDPFVAALRKEEDDICRAQEEEDKRNATEGRVNEELFDEQHAESAAPRPKDILPPSKTSKASTAGSRDNSKPAAPNNESDEREINHLWKDSLRIRSADQSSYLRKCRGLDALDTGILEHSPFLRFVDSLGYKFYFEDGDTSETQTHPALLAFCVGATGLVASLQRIYLQRHNGDRFYSKLEVQQFAHRKNNVKRSMGALNYDSQFFMAQPGRVEAYPFVALSEGPEKALAVAACSRYLPSFASFGVGRYDKFEHFRTMEPQPTLIIAGDADHTIENQQAKIAALKRAGWREIIHWIPTCGFQPGSTCKCKDANDVIEAHGLWELRRSLLIPEWAWVTRFAPDSPLYEPPEKEWRRYDFLSKYVRR